MRTLIEITLSFLSYLIIPCAIIYMTASLLSDCNYECNSYHVCKTLSETVNTVKDEVSK
jgi:hypothetical protein